MPESQLMSSTVTRLNIPVTHSRKFWMENTGIIGSSSRDLGLESNYITNIDKRINRRRIITNAVLPSGWNIAVCWARASSDSILIEMIDTKEKNNRWANTTK